MSNKLKIEKQSVETEKPVKVKGVSTVTGGKDPLQDALAKPFTEALEYREPKDAKDAFIGDISGRAGSSETSNIKGHSGLINTDALNAIYAPVNLAEGLPDYHEREKFKAYHGDKMVKLFDENTYGIRFERDLEDMAIYKEKQYPLAVKKFMDDLDENQAWYTEIALSASKFIGKTSLAIGSIVPTIYGAGLALLEGDSSKVFDNHLFDAWEYMDQGMDKHLGIYGGSDVWHLNTETGNFKQKEFVARFWNDPLKSINADIVPAASFVAGAVGTELLAGAFTVGTGGLGAGLLAANSARLTAKVGSWGSRLNKFSKTSRLIRGLDVANDIKSAARIEKMTKQYRSAYGTVASGYRSASYESALIARDTQDATLQALLDKHAEENNGREPTDLEMTRYKRTAADSGESAYFMNIPLVATSNFIQMPRLFMKNYTVARAGGSLLGKTKLSGTRYVKDAATGGFKHAANAESKLLRRLGYTKAVLKGPITEGWEEFAQGAMQEGLVDYYAQNSSVDSNRNIVGMLDAIRKQGSSYLNTVEGRDSVTIGALMGLLGLRAPVRIDAATGKMNFSLRGTAFGGSAAEVRALRDTIKTARTNAEKLNASPIDVSPMLKMNMDNGIRNQAIQKDLDDAAIQGDINEFKNKEHATTFSSIYNRTEQGLAGSVFQEMDALDKMPLKKFNELYSTKGIEVFTEESKKQAITKAREQVTQIVKSIEETQEVLNKSAPDLFQKAAKSISNAFRKTKKGEAINPAFLTDGMKEQLAYLHSTVANTQAREVALTEEITKHTKNAFNLEALNKIATQMVGITEAEKIEFTNKVEETKKAILQEWKESDPTGYDLNLIKVDSKIKGAPSLLDDLLKLKVRRGEAAKLYQGMLTPKGANLFAGFAQELHSIAMRNIGEQMKEQIEKNAANIRNAKGEAEILNEKSVTNGKSDVTDFALDESATKGLAEYDSINWDAISPEELDGRLQNIIDKHPGLLLLLKSRLKARGIDVTGITTSKDIWNRDPDGGMVSGLFTDLADLHKQYVNIKDSVEDDPKFDSTEDSDQPVREGSSKTDPATFTERKGLITEEVLDESNEVGAHHIYINTHDKVIENGKVVLDPDTGKPMLHIAASNVMYPLDTKKVNSPDFLNNTELANGEHSFEFRVQEGNKYNNTATTENLVIEVVHIDPVTKEETFISFLPSVKENTPSHLMALREEIVRRNNLTDKEIEAAQEERKAKIKALKDKKAAIKEELKNSIKPKSQSTQQSGVDAITEDEIRAVALPRTFFADRIDRIKEVINGKRKGSVAGNLGNLVASPKDNDFNEKDSKGRFIADGGSAVYLTKEENKEIARINAKRTQGMITAAEKSDAVQEVIQGAFKRALATYDVIEDAPTLPVKERVEAFKSQPTQQTSEVERLRQEEQAELLKAIPNAEKYLTDGKVDKSKIKNKKHIVKFEKIYDKYDKLISPLLKPTQQTEEEIFNEKVELHKKLLEVQREIDYSKDGPLTLLQQLENELAFEKGEFGNVENAKAIEEQIKNLKNTLTAEKVEEVVEKETTAEDISTIAKEENITKEEAEKLVKDGVLTHIKKFGNKLIKSPATRLKKVINKILKKIMAMVIGGTLIVTAASFSYNNDGTLTFSIENAVDNLLPTEQGQWAKRYLDKKGIIDIAESQIVTEDKVPVVSETVKPEVIFEVIGTVPDSYSPSDSLLSYRSQWDNADGFRYIPAPVKKDLPSGGLKVSGVVGVGHFLLDASVAPGKEYSHEFNKSYLATAKENNDWVPAFTSNIDGSVTVKYKRAADITSKDLVVSPLRQMSFNEINFGETQTPAGFKVGINEVVKEDGTGTYLIFKTRDGYSRFSGGSVVFIFNDKHGNTIVRDFAGSINQIQNEGKGITDQYNLEEGALTIGYHDVGSFSAKPKAKDGTISSDQWAGFNPEGMTGGALMIPIHSNIMFSTATSFSSNSTHLKNKGNIQEQAPVKEGGLGGLLGLTLLSALATVKRKQKNNEEVTEEDLDNLEKLKEEILTKIKEETSTAKQVVKAPQDKATTEKLKEQLKEVNEEIAEFADFTIKVDRDSPNVFAAITALEGMSKRNKVGRAKALAKLESFGQENIDRANIINDNFDDIIKSIIDSGLNVFFDSTTGTHEEC